MSMYKFNELHRGNLHELSESLLFLVVIFLHWIYIIFQFFIASIVSKKNFFTMLKCQIPGYTTALGTQSSAATIPVNLSCAEKMGICLTKKSRVKNF